MGPILRLLRELENAPYLVEAPTGYPEAGAGWASSGAMVNRVEFALEYSSLRFRGASPSGRRILDLVPEEGDVSVRAQHLAQALVPGEGSGRVAELALEAWQAEESQGDRRGSSDAMGVLLGVILASPDFQKH